VPEEAGLREVEVISKVERRKKRRGDGRGG
jgi:hypothetical protein